MANKMYEEANIQAIADALRLKTDGDDCLYMVNSMGHGVLGLPFGNIPAHHQAEAGRVISRLLELKAAHPNYLLFGTISDNHVDKTNANAMASARHAAFALEAVGAMADCDFVANLGDNPVDSNVDTEAGYSNALYMENCTRFGLTNMLGFSLVGNHDKSNSTQRLYDLMGRFNAFDDHGLTQIRGYGYKDLPEKKVRILVLNTCDYWNGQGGNGMSYEQKDFLIRALDLSGKDEPSKWLTVILSHIPLDFLGGDYNKGADLKAIVKAYDSGTSVSIAVNSAYASQQSETPSGYATYSGGNLVYDYSGKNAAKVVNIHGHIHTNAYGKLKFIDDSTELNILRAATANSAFSQNKTESYPDYGDYSITAAEAAKLLKSADSVRDTSATFYFFDLDDQVIYSIGYGADADRTIPYKDAAVYSVTYNLTDVFASNTTSTVIEGEPYSTTLSVGNGYALDSVVVTMGGSVVSGLTDGNIHIPEVTGNIVITATAKDNYVPHWDIGDRTAVSYSKGASAAAAMSRHGYYLGTADTGAWYPDRITAHSVSGNDITFTSTEKNIGVGVPFRLEAGASYTFSANASAKARLRVCFHNADGTYLSGGSYSSSGTNLEMEFAAPADSTAWVMLILDCYTAGQSVTYTNVSLTKNG